VKFSVFVPVRFSVFSRCFLAVLVVVVSVFLQVRFSVFLPVKLFALFAKAGSPPCVSVGFAGFFRVFPVKAVPQ
jgi:hypothetical protein